MSKVDKKLAAAKHSSDPIEYFKNSPDVGSVKVIQDEIEVTFKKTGNSGKRIFPIMYGREG